MQWALTKALNPPDSLDGPKMPPQLGSTEISEVSGYGRTGERLTSTPRLISFTCDGKVLSATVELIVELPIRIAFAGVDFAKYFHQVVAVEVGLVLGENR